MTNFLLKEYTDLLQSNNLLINYNIKENNTVNSITYNSKEVIPGTLFVCKGKHFTDAYLQESIKKGAIAYISESIYPRFDSSYIIVNDIRKAMAIIIKFYYGNILEKIKLIGITGTKGKSTTCYFVRSILDTYLSTCKNPKSAIISSIDTYDGIVEEESTNTTPEAIELYHHFSNAVHSNIKFLEMEVSSQALKYDRVLGINFDIACFLNIDVDHISPIEHKDFEDYFSSKLKIFDQCKYACINIDDSHSDRILACAKKAKHTITFGMNHFADVYGYDLKKTDKSIKFKVKTNLPNHTSEIEYEISIPGLFNVQNAIAAIAISTILNIPHEYIKHGLKNAIVPGRMEIFESIDKKIISIVDYAHNKLSYETLFSSIKKEYPTRKIIAVFGSPGCKAFDRRTSLPQIASKYADFLIITEEDYAEENPQNICNDIAKHIIDCDYQIIINRDNAIKKAFSLTKEKCVILLLGKGRETTIKRGNKYEPCVSDFEHAKKFIEAYDNNISLKI